MYHARFASHSDQSEKQTPSKSTANISTGELKSALLIRLTASSRTQVDSCLCAKVTSEIGTVDRSQEYEQVRANHLTNKNFYVHHISSTFVNVKWTETRVEKMHTLWPIDSPQENY